MDSRGDLQRLLAVFREPCLERLAREGLLNPLGIAWLVLDNENVFRHVSGVVHFGTSGWWVGGGVAVGCRQPHIPQIPLAFPNDLPHTTFRTFRATISVRHPAGRFQRMVFSALIVGFPARLEGITNPRLFYEFA